MKTFADMELQQEFIFGIGDNNTLWKKYSSDHAIRMERDPNEKYSYREIPGYVREVPPDTEVFYISDYRF